MKKQMISAGENAPTFSIKDVTNNEIIVGKKSGIQFVTFFRFASCPFCNLRLRSLNEFAQKYPQVEIIGIFGSPKNEVAKSIAIHSLVFPLVSDSNGELYRAYKIKKSLFGMFKGMFGRMPSLLGAIFVDHYIPKNPHGHLLTMPAEFLIVDGVVKFSYYGKDEGDHSDLKEIEDIIDTLS